MRSQTKQLKEIAEKLEQTEQRLYVTEDKYRQLAENADCIILRIDTQGSINYLNEFAQKFFGFTERSILGKKVLGTLVSPKDGPGQSAAALVRDIKRNPQHYANYEKEVMCKDGRRVWVAWTNKAIHDQQKNITGILCIGHDITERKRIENELHLLATAMRNSNDAITVQDLKGKILSWNLGAERLYGYCAAEALQMNIRRTVPEHKQDEMEMLLKRVIKGEKIELFETQRITKNHRILHISLTATLLNNEKGKPFAITTTERDITQRRFLEKEILDITERERELIGQEMHDGMGQALTGIALKSKGLALKLRKQLAAEKKDALAISKLANEAIVQMRNLVTMLYPIDIETGGLLSALEKLAVNTEEIMGVPCRFQHDSEATVKNMVEAKQIYRIVQESITNAIKHGKAKKISIKLQLMKAAMKLSVINDGRAFPKLSPKSKGLGLKIMKYRTDLIGGSLDIRKGTKGGTVVTCVFPHNR